MPDTFVKIASVTVGSGGAASMTFSSIPSTYTDLCIEISARGTRASIVDAVSFKFNSDTTAANYKIVNLYGTGSATGSFSGSTYIIENGWISGATATANTFGSTTLYAPNYTSSNAKSFSVDSASENNATGAWMNMSAYSWTGTAAISTIEIISGYSASFVQYSTATLYGIKSS